MNYFFLANFENVKKKRFEKSIQSNPVNVSYFKVHFSTFAKVFEKYLFSLAFYGKFAINQIKNLSEKSQSFCWIFLIFFNSFWILGKNFLAGVSKLQSKCTLEHFEKSLSSTNRTFFWNFVPISWKKVVFLAIFFETFVETASYGYRRLLW